MKPACLKNGTFWNFISVTIKMVEVKNSITVWMTPLAMSVPGSGEVIVSGSVTPGMKACDCVAGGDASGMGSGDGDGEATTGDGDGSGWRMGAYQGLGAGMGSGEGSGDGSSS